MLIQIYTIFHESILPISDIANICYSTSIKLFSTIFSVYTDRGNGKNLGGNITNLIAVRCNMSCLRRFLSSFLSDLILNTTKECQDDSFKSIIYSQDSPLLENKMKSKFEKKFRYKIYSPLDYLNQALEMCQESFLVINGSTTSSLKSSGASSILTAEMATNYMFQGK